MLNPSGFASKFLPLNKDQMPIPASTPEGFLPPGIFDCSLADIRSRFGRFQMSDRRPRLFARLEELIQAMHASGLFVEVLVDGSFVTDCANPNDIDLIAVLKKGHNFERDLTISEYAMVSRALLRRRFGFDVIVAESESSLYRRYVEFFSLVREAPDARKGMLRLTL